MMTSFSNPNYTLNDPDALNSNLPLGLSSAYCDNDPHLYGDDTPHLATSPRSDAASKRRKKYAGLDMSTALQEDGGDLMVHNDLCSPDSLASDDSSSAPSGGSGAASPVLDATLIPVEHTEHEEGGEGDEGAPLSGSGQGFLGFYASLELSAAARRRREEEEEEKERQEQEEEQDEDERHEQGEETVPLVKGRTVKPAPRSKMRHPVNKDGR